MFRYLHPPFFVSLELVVSPFFEKKIDVSFDTLGTIYILFRMYFMNCLLLILMTIINNNVSVI